MGSAMARVLFDIERPTVGCSISASRRSKGWRRCARPAASCARANSRASNIIGFVEGDDIGKGVVDVVVTEGFAGNIALKTAEGTARQIAEYLRGAMSRTWRARIGYLFAPGVPGAARQNGSA
jgi:glycerol-3-phosphate acyltransferase PlsX